MNSPTRPPVGARLADRAHLRRSERRSIVRLGAAATITHGLVHAMGVTLLWQWGNGLQYTEHHPAPGSTLGILTGWAWLLAGALFVVAGALILLGRREWRAVALVAVAISMPVLIPFSDAALAGLFVDIAILGAVILTLGTRPTLAREGYR
jgi:hypothetical protein